MTPGQPYSVTGLVEEVDTILSRHYPRVLVEAEIRQLSQSPAGHVFMTLTDGRSNLGAVCWRTTWRSLRYRPDQGDRVLVRGRLSVYAQRGLFQLYVNDLRPAGLGKLAREIEARKMRLAAEGLLDDRRKRPLPQAPRVVGVATSLGGAALQDFLRVSGERFPATRIVVAHTSVQGPRAPAEIIQAVELLVEQGEAEVIVVTRGGGSVEDLLAFQDETLARCLAHLPVPVVSAVGHEVDTTIADLVADVAVPTPTAAAVRVLPDGPALSRGLEQAELRLEEGLIRLLRRRRERVSSLEQRLRHPARRLSDVRRRAVEARARLDRVVQQDLRTRRERLRSLEARLQALSPRAVLDRGYAIVHGPDGVVSRADRVSDGTDLDVELAAGRLQVRVTGGGSRP